MPTSSGRREVPGYVLTRGRRGTPKGYARRSAGADRGGSEAGGHRTHPRPRRPRGLRGGALRLVGRASLRPPLGASLPHRPICQSAAGPNGRRSVRPPEPLYATEDRPPRRGACERVASWWSGAGHAGLAMDSHAGAHSRPRLPIPSRRPRALGGVTPWPPWTPTRFWACCAASGRSPAQRRP